MDIDALKQAAIDAYMRSEGYTVHDDGTYSDDGLGFSSTVGADGTGTRTYATGADASPATSDEDYTGEWEIIRARVDTALEDWQEDRLPDPAELDAGVVRAREAVIALNVGNDTTYGGALGGYLATVTNNAPRISGAAGNAFNNSFVNQLGGVLGNHGWLPWSPRPGRPKGTSGSRPASTGTPTWRR